MLGAHLELARLAMFLKRRVLVLQAVEHAQQDTSNPFKRFIGELHGDERRIDELETGINSVLLRLSSLEWKRHGGFRVPASTPGEVDHLIQTVYRLRADGDGVNMGIHQADVAIEIEQAATDRGVPSGRCLTRRPVAPSATSIRRIRGR